VEEIGKILISQYGFIGISTIAMAGVIVYLFKDSKKERLQMRKEHLAERESIRLQHFEERKILQATADNQFDTIVKITQENTNALRGIESLVQSIDRRTE
jgi:hypothetical protein